MRRGAQAGVQEAELRGPRCARTAHDESVPDAGGRRRTSRAADGPRAARQAIPPSRRRDPPDRRGRGAGHHRDDRGAGPQRAASPRCRGDQRHRARHRGRAGADRAGPGHDRGRRASPADRRIAPPPLPGHRDGGRRLRRGGGTDGCDHAPDRAGRPWHADGGPAAAFLAGGGGLSRSGRHRRAGRRRRGRGALAEQAVAPNGVGDAAADRGGTGDHRRAVTDRPGTRGGRRGGRRPACWSSSGCRTAGWTRRAWPPRCGRAGCQPAR